tara:strand:- start:17052 stop:17867 length:816 start_codon:yes stop_codon:yes gene_type:complete
MISNQNYLLKIAKDIRKIIFDKVSKRGGHISTSFSAVEILVSLYFDNYFRFNKKLAKSSKRDFFILSKGHAAILMFAILFKKGIISKKNFDTNYKDGNYSLGGHVSHKTLGVEASTGAVGHGLGLASGIAFANKIKKVKNFTYALLGDAECSEGSVWEAALFANKHKLNNLIAIIDNNKIGATEFTQNYIEFNNLANMFQSFGWIVKKCDGHNFKSIKKNIISLKKNKALKPKILIAETIKGKGLKFLENDPSWHSRKMSKIQIDLGLKKL